MKTKLIGVVTLMLAGGLAVGQDFSSTTQAAPKMGSGSGSSSKKSDLELALEDALKNNPDLRVAVAKAAEADAQLSRARAQVVQKVVAAWQAIDAAKANKEACEARMNQLAKLRNVIKSGVSDDDSRAAVASAAQAKATLATAESELEYLTGKGKQAETIAVAIRYLSLRTVHARQVELGEKASK